MKNIIQRSLKEAADPKKGILIANYMKNVTPYRGLQQPGIQNVFDFFKKQIKELSNEQRFQLAEQLIQSEYGEDKKFGLMICDHIEFDKDRVKYTEDWFVQGHIREWASADTYCMRVLKRYLQDLQNAQLMEEWAQHENLWIRRSSCVGFVGIIRKFQVDMDMLYRICQLNIVHSERFNQLGTGWLLREMAQKDLQGVLNFIEHNLNYFSSEGLRYAYEKMKQKDQNHLKSIWKESQVGSEEIKQKQKPNTNTKAKKRKI